MCLILFPYKIVKQYFSIDHISLVTHLLLDVIYDIQRTKTAQQINTWKHL